MQSGTAEVSGNLSAQTPTNEKTHPPCSRDLRYRKASRQPWPLPRRPLENSPRCARDAQQPVWHTRRARTHPLSHINTYIQYNASLITYPELVCARSCSTSSPSIAPESSIMRAFLMPMEGIGVGSSSIVSARQSSNVRLGRCVSCDIPRPAQTSDAQPARKVLRLNTGRQELCSFQEAGNSSSLPSRYARCNANRPASTRAYAQVVKLCVCQEALTCFFVFVRVRCL